MSVAPVENTIATGQPLRKIWIALPFVFLLWAGLHTPFLVLDFWWHLKLGEVIVTTQSIPSTDLFSFTAEGRPFIAQNWLAEVLLFLFYRVAGLEGLVIAGTALVLATLFLIHRISRRDVSDVRVVAVADLLVVVGLMLCSNLRTQLFSFLFFAIAYWALDDFHRGRWKKLAVLPPLMLLWVNMHGAFVLGLLLFVVYLIAVSLPAFVAGMVRETRDLLLRGTMLLLLTALATLANPSGWRVYEYVAEVSRDPASRTYVQEWQPPRIDEPEMLMAVFGPAVLVLVAIVVSRRRPPAIEVLLVLMFLAFALNSRRNAIWFSIIAGPIFARQLAQYPWGRLGARFRSSAVPSANSRRMLNAAIVAVLAALSAVFSPWVYPHLGNEKLGTSLLDKRTPVAAVDFIESHGLFGRLFHPQIYGDYLIWRLWPRQKTFIDGRVHLFPAEIADGYIQAMNAMEWERWFDRWQIERVLLSKDEPDARALLMEVGESPSWELLFEDNRSALFARRR